jgi:hypothetical protein
VWLHQKWLGNPPYEKCPHRASIVLLIKSLSKPVALLTNRFVGPFHFAVKDLRYSSATSVCPPSGSPRADELQRRVNWSYKTMFDHISPSPFVDDFVQIYNLTISGISERITLFKQELWGWHV